MPTSDRPRRAAHFGARAPETDTPETAASGDAPVSSPDVRTGNGQSPVPDVPVIASNGATSPHPALGSARLSNRTAATTQRTASKAGTHQRRGGARLNLPALIVGFAVIAVIGFVAYRFVLPLFSGSSSDKSQSIVAGQTVQVTIPEGSSASQVAQALYDAGVISSTDDFLTQVHRRDLESSLKSGTYTFVTGGDTDSILSLLTTGPNSSSASITIPEGYTVTKIAASVETTFGISADDFIAQAKASNYVADYPFLSAAANDSLEGFLFPKTYDFSGQTVTADLIIRAMLNQYQTEMASYDFATSEAAIQSTYGVTMSDYQIITMASIIEREAVTDDDRPLVASVFYNRLRDGMKLQSDATMGYVTGGEVTADDLKTDSPYNTYLYGGLPPTPICSPSSASIAAALSPSSTDYYYFFISDTVHQFSETYEEHQQAISAAQAA